MKLGSLSVIFLLVLVWACTSQKTVHLKVHQSEVQNNYLEKASHYRGIASATEEKREEAEELLKKDEDD